MATLQRLSVNILQLGDRILTTDPYGLYIDGDSITTLFNVDKYTVGLGNLTNDAQVKRSEMAQPLGVATLDEDGLVPYDQLPPFVGGGGSGTVTSVAISSNTSWLSILNSPITSSGTIAINKTTGLAANKVLATPNGSTGTVDLRPLELEDLPQIATARILGRNTAGTGLIEVLSVSTTRSLLSLNNVENTALSTWVGSTSITTLGTITTGTIPIARISGLSAYQSKTETLALAGFSSITGRVGNGNLPLGAQLYDTAGTPIIAANFSTRELLAPDGISVLSWNSSSEAVLMNGTIFLESDGGVVAFYFAGDGGPLTNLNIEEGNVTGRIGNANLPLGAQLYDNAGTPKLSADFGERRLLTLDGEGLAISWAFANEGITLKYGLLDSFDENLSVDPNNRQLVNSVSIASIDWSDTGYVNFFDGEVFIDNNGSIDANGNIQATAFAGDGSNLTALYNLTLTANQSVRRNSGNSAYEMFRAQEYDADLVSLAGASGTNTIYYRSAANTWSAVTIGSNLTFSSGTLSGSGGSPAGSTGAIQFNNSGSFAANANKLYWDNTNYRLGVGVAVPEATLDIGAEDIAATVVRITGSSVSEESEYPRIALLEIHGTLGTGYGEVGASPAYGIVFSGPGDPAYMGVASGAGLYIASHSDIIAFEDGTNGLWISATDKLTLTCTTLGFYDADPVAQGSGSFGINEQLKYLGLFNNSSTISWDGAAISTLLGGTGSSFTKFSGPATTEKTKTLSNANDTILELGGSYTPTGKWIFSASGAASTPTIKVSGVPFAGTGTTSFPLVYINDANATASTTLNTAGTYFGVNGDGTQDLMNLLKDGTSQFKVSSVGDLTTTGIVNIASGKTYQINSIVVIRADTSLGNYFFGPSGNLTASGGNNVGIGVGPLGGVTSGGYNVAIGINALGANAVTGSDNLGLGAFAIWKLTSGSNNTGFGSSALGENTEGSNNVGVGRQALPSNTKSNQNTAIGYQALYTFNVTSTTDTKNTAIGSSAGYDLTTGTYNTFIGAVTGLGITTGGKNTIVGANVSGLSSSLSNNVIIADGDGNIRIQVGSTGGVSGNFIAAQNTQNADYTFVLADGGKHIYHSSGSAHNYTIPSSSIAYPIGTMITIVNTNGAGNITLAITSDTLRRGDGTAGTGSRTIAADSVVTILKIASTEWIITGSFT